MSNIETLKDTVEPMLSEDYCKRFESEYHQLRIRYEKLKAMLIKWDRGKLEFTPTCPRSTYALQIEAMEKYMAVLEARAVMENVKLFS